MPESIRMEGTFFTAAKNPRALGEGRGFCYPVKGTGSLVAPGAEVVFGAVLGAAAAV
jgi:hypothetical protein